MDKVGYLGPEGSYSHIAAKTFRPNANLCGYGSFMLAVEALVKGECTSVALPVENSLNGSVAQVMDLLQYTENVFAFEECTVKIDHRFAVLKGAEKRGISRIYSHEQALAQCGKFIFENFPEAELIATPSTAASLKMLKSAADACIVGAHTNFDGVVLSEENIADEKNNLTHFLLVKKGSAESAGHCAKVYFSATCKHEAGALFNLLSVIKNGGLNMTKIQSRPIKDKAGEYRFFVEVEGDFADAHVKQVLAEVKRAANSFKILGAY